MRARAIVPVLLSALVLSAVGLAAPPPAAAADTVTLVRTIDTSSWPSSDPSGATYDPIQDRLIVVDGEIEESNMAWLWAGYNGYVATREGAFTYGFDTTTASPKNNEPVGAAYDPGRDELYVSKDGSSSRIWVYSRSGNGRFETVVRSFLISSWVSDAEGLAFGAGKLYVADGAARRVSTFGPGQDGVVGTSDDPAPTSFDVGTLGQRDPEGIEYHPVSGNLWVVTRNKNPQLLEVTAGGVAVRSFDLTFLNTQFLAGLTIAPASDGSGGLNVYITDRGIDNNNDSSANDGKIYELAVVDGGGGDPPPPPPSGGIVNGGFEEADSQGAPTGWSSDNRFRRSDAVVHGGSFAGRHQATDNSAYKVEQDATVSGGTTYDVSAWINVPATSDSFTFIVRVQWRGSSGKIAVEDLVKLKGSTAGWQEFSRLMTAPSGATTARVMMVVKSLNATIYVDDVAL